MKRFVILLFMPFACAAQGLKLNQYDVFLKQQRIELNSVALLSSPSAKISVTFSSVASDCFVQVKGAGWGAVTVDEGDELRFLLSNDSTITATSISLQTFEPGIPQSTYKHTYRIAEAGLQALSRNELVGLRKYSFKAASDLRLPKEAAGKLEKPAALFLAEYKKANSVKRLKQINGSEAAEHIGDSVEFCSKVFNVRKSTNTQDGETVLQLQGDFSSPIVDLVIMPEDRSKFDGTSETIFLNKDVCVKGILVLRNDTPTMVAKSKDQLILKSSTGTQTTQ